MQPISPFYSRLTSYDQPASSHILHIIKDESDDPKKNHLDGWWLKALSQESQLLCCFVMIYLPFDVLHLHNL